MCAGGIHDSGSRPINKSSRRCRASAQSVLARFFALQRRRLGRLSQMHLGADLLELLDHEPPASRCLQRDLQRLAAETGQELRTPARSAGTILARDTSPVPVSIHSAEICADADPNPSPQTRHHLPQTPKPAPHAPPREQGSARPIAYREPRSVPPVRMAGRAAAIRARLRRRSTRRTGHLHHPRSHSQTGHHIFHEAPAESTGPEPSIETAESGLAASLACGCCSA